MRKKDYDVIIVGGGPAGIFTALELCQSADLRILLLEKGKDLSTESRAAVLNAFNEGQERLGRQRDRLVKLLG